MEKLIKVRTIEGLDSETFFATEQVNVNDKVVVDINGSLFIGKVLKFEDEFEVDKPSLIVRKASTEDLEKIENLKKNKRDALHFAKSKASKLKLDMKVLDVVYSLDGGKLVFIFSSENRVDFRIYVKELASFFKKKIELKQVGARDEAKIVGGIGPCGKVCCCKQLEKLPNVSIKMAKAQNLSLNPTKINGICGRLMCCLAYENDIYAEAIKNMPRIDTFVKTPDGNGYVVFNDLLKGLTSVKVMDEKSKLPVINAYKLEDIKILPNKQGKTNE